jgi:hypothetical protein
MDIGVFIPIGNNEWLISTTSPQATTWAVPLDDTHTMQIGYYRAPEGKEPRQSAGFGRDASRLLRGTAARSRARHGAARDGDPSSVFLRPYEGNPHTDVDDLLVIEGGPKRLETGVCALRKR